MHLSSMVAPEMGTVKARSRINLPSIALIGHLLPLPSTRPYLCHLPGSVTGAAIACHSAGGSLHASAPSDPSHGCGAAGRRCALANVVPGTRPGSLPGCRPARGTTSPAPCPPRAGAIDRPSVAWLVWPCLYGVAWHDDRLRLVLVRLLGANTTAMEETCGACFLGRIAGPARRHAPSRRNRTEP